MGVWIETLSDRLEAAKSEVTPCMGVWIETVVLSSHLFVLGSHPVWVCGLKRL